MIRLTKHTAPEVLKRNSIKWTKEYIRAKRSSSMTATIETRYRHPEIKSALLVETSNKCAYCESFFRTVVAGDIEHIIPKSKDERFINCWSNLTISCPECNRRKKSYYDQTQPFLNPYVDPVDDLLIHLGPLVFHKPGNERAELTVKLLEYNLRIDLIEKKKEMLNNIQGILDKIAVTKNKVLKALLINEVKEMAAENREYSAMVSATLKQFGV